MEDVLDYKEQESIHSYASFGARLLAAIIDGLIVGIIQWGLMYFITDMNDPSPMASLLSIAVAWIYHAYQNASEKQATIGKSALGLIVTDMEGQRISFGTATGRYFGKIISAMILLIGYIMQPFTEKKQALHDKLAGTLVYKTN